VQIARQLPDDIATRAWSYRELRALGVSRRELEGALWCSPYQGVYVWAARSHNDPDLRIQAARLLLPDGGAITGWAACRSHGVEVLDGYDGLLRPVPLMLAVPPPKRLVPRDGIRVLRSRLDPGDVGGIEGVPVARLLRGAFDAMRMSSMEEAVVVADAVLRSGRLREELAVYIAAHAGWLGVERARSALAIADRRAESPNESRMRVVWHSAGLPRPEVNVRVYDDDGNFLGRPDLLDEEAAVAVEYDGSEHRKLARQTSDNVREEGFEGSGLTVVKATAVDLFFERARLQRRLIDARSRGLRRDRRRDRWTLEPLPWWIAAG